MAALPWNAAPDVVAGVLREGSRRARACQTDFLRQVVAVQRRRRSIGCHSSRGSTKPAADFRRCRPRRASLRICATPGTTSGARPMTSQRLERQSVVLTVPASFDEEARELTVQAARDAGLPAVTLLEEPLAALYAWIAAHPRRPMATLGEGALVLVCDVGGGTTDFSLLRVNVEAGDLGIRTDCDRRTPAARWRQPRSGARGPRRTEAAGRDRSGSR